VDPQLGSMGYVFVGTEDGVVALDVATGGVVWTFPTPRPVTSSPAAPGGVVYFGSDDFNLYAVDAASGQEIWRRQLGAEVRSSPAVDAAGNVYVGACDGLVYAFQPDGDPIFQFVSSGLIIPSPTLGTDGLLYIGSDDRFLHALGADPFNLGNLRAPRLDDLTPASAPQGAVVEATLRGADLDGATRLDLGPGVGVIAARAVSSREMKLTLTLDGAAPIGVRNVGAGRAEGLRSTRVRGFEVTFDCRRSDISGDGAVDGLDLAILAATFGSEGMSGRRPDLSGDGQVDGEDLSLLAARFGRPADGCR
jgi:hypothetical protein